MLILPEEILLIALNDESGKLHTLPERALDLALAGAVLMELEKRGAVTLSDENLQVTKGCEPGDPLLEDCLRQLCEKDPEQSIQAALGRLAHQGKEICSTLFKRLVQRGILEEKDCRFFLVFHETRHPVVDPAEENAVKTRIRDIVLGDKVPTRNEETAVISLMHACDLSHKVFSVDELRSVKPRIEALAKTNPIGHATVQAITQIQNAMLEIIAYSGM